MPEKPTLEERNDFLTRTMKYLVHEEGAEINVFYIRDLISTLMMSMLYVYPSRAVWKLMKECFVVAAENLDGGITVLDPRTGTHIKEAFSFDRRASMGDPYEAEAWLNGEVPDYIPEDLV